MFLSNLFFALHVIGFVAWFAGLFYLVRLFIYHKQSQINYKNETKIALAFHEQFTIMEFRLCYIICVPAMLLTLFSGGILAYLTGNLGSLWLTVKLLFIFLLTFYQCYVINIMIRFREQLHNSYSINFLRFFNELATILLLIIVLTATFKDWKNVTIITISFIIIVLIIFKCVKYLKEY